MSSWLLLWGPRVAEPTLPSGRGFIYAVLVNFWGFSGTASQSVLVSQHLPFCSSRNQIISVKVDKLSLTLIPDTGMRLSIEVDLGITSAP